MRPLIFFVTPDAELAHSGALALGQAVNKYLAVGDKVKTLMNCLAVGLANAVVGRSSNVRAEAGLKSRLTTNVDGLEFTLPVGISAGFDKNGKLASFFTRARNHGLLLAGHAEIGSVSYLPWTGNAKPRLFRLPQDKAIINRMGLNNDGAEVVATRLSECGKLRRIGLNITKTPDAKIEGAEAVEDFVKSFNFMQFIDGVDWITLNISCPNTAEGKTFEDPAALADLLGKLTGGAQTVWLKLAPLQARSDAVPAVDGVFSVAEDFGVKTLVIANTVPDRTLDDMKSSPTLLGERGGLSGPPIFSRSLPLVSEAFRRGFTVIGVGGVSSGQDAYRLIRAGASLIQLYTAMVYDGPGVFEDIHAGLERCLVLDGYSRLANVVGKDLAHGDVQNV